MAFLKSIVAENFRSFGRLSVELKRLNVLIGANASGKSNFVQALRFLRDLHDSGLENAVSLQGGAEFFANKLSNGPAASIFEFEATPSAKTLNIIADGPTQFDVSKIRYRVVVSHSEASGPEVPEEQLQLHLDVLRRGATSAKGIWTIAKANGEYRWSAEGLPLLKLLPEFPDPAGAQETLLHSARFRFLENTWPSLAGMGIYDVDPGQVRIGVLDGKSDLEYEAGNLSIVLRKLLRDPETKRSLLNLVGVLLPFVKDLSPEVLSDGSKFFRLAESWAGAASFEMPASVISTGTAAIVAIVVALFFESKSLVVIEEPDRGLHPALVPRLAELLKDAAAQTQVVITTHNPELLRYVDPSYILLVERGADGFSTVTRPSEDDTVKRFLEDQMGMNELYVNDLLSFQKC